MLKATLIKYFIILEDLAYSYKLKHQYTGIIKKLLKNRPKKLKNTEITEIRNFYSKYGLKAKPYWHEFYFSINNHFSVEYIPGDIFHAILNKKLNQMRQWPALLDKNLLYNLFQNFNQPEIVIKNINGFFYFGGSLITKEMAIERVRSQKCQMIIKPSIDSGNGQNVVVFEVKKDLTSFQNLSVPELFLKYNKDFIIQFLVDQHSSLKLLNPDSLNTLRVLSYLNDNGVHVLSTVIRIGKKGQFTDNISTGGIFCGVEANGKLKEWGYSENGTRCRKTDSAVELKDFQIPVFKEVMDVVKKMHLLIPYFRLVSWDIGIDKTETPVLIEYNTYHQGIYGHQLANGPLFGKFTDEILSQSKR